eukprot:gene15618-biopygen20204
MQSAARCAMQSAAHCVMQSAAHCAMQSAARCAMQSAARCAERDPQGWPSVRGAAAGRRSLVHRRPSLGTDCAASHIVLRNGENIS